MMDITRQRGQTAVEYLILLGVVTAVVLAGFNFYFSRTAEESEGFYNMVQKGIYDDPPNPRTFMSNNP